MENSSPLKMKLASVACSLETMRVPEERHDSREHRVEKRCLEENQDQFRQFKRSCREQIGLPEEHNMSEQVASLTYSLETMCKMEVRPDESLESTEHRAEKRKYARDTGEQLRSSKRRWGDQSGTSGSSGEDDDDDSAVPAEQIDKHLSFAGSEKRELYHLDKYHSRQIERPKLVLDLDHTLLNSTHLLDLSVDEVHLADCTIPKKDNGLLHRLDVDNWCMIVNLRPFVHKFLEEANKMFDLYVYTMGTRRYATEVVKLLDPENQYFPSKVISRAKDSRRVQKSLDIVKASRESTIIIDDKLSVWKEEDKANIIVIERYNFFSSSCKACNSKSKSLAEMQSDESEADGNLAAMLSVLRHAYENFSDMDRRGQHPDLRTILRQPPLPRSPST